LAAILAGNAVLLKPSEWTSRSAQWLEVAIDSSTILPKGLFSVAIGDGIVGAQVVQEADQIMFTGSVNGGRLVAEAAAKALKPAILELGGKHPMIVLEDAPLERAAKAAVWGAFANCGQLCVGVERAYVEAGIYDRFVQAVQREMVKIRQGIEGTDVDLGRLIFPPQLQVVQGHLADARAMGASVIGGEMIDEARLLMRPALVLDATRGMKVMSEETFGPVLPIMRVQNAEEAVRLANASHLGLSASVWTKDLRRGRLIGSTIQAGLVGINDVMSHYAMASLPFGGVKQSGLGFRHSEEGLRQFCMTQSVILHRWPLQFGELWWFPYTPLKTHLVSFLTRL
jgi:acyl-CoA reductase-like NAD-dependent aldehyde dehydrogenase